jgi:hypothetical protein
MGTKVVITLVFCGLVYFVYLIIAWKMMKSWVERTVKKWLGR